MNPSDGNSAEEYAGEEPPRRRRREEPAGRSLNALLSSHRGFWACCMWNHPVLRDFLTREDFVFCHNHLIDVVAVDPGAEHLPVRLVFGFPEANSLFTNEELLLDLAGTRSTIHWKVDQSAADSVLLQLWERPGASKMEISEFLVGIAEVCASPLEYYYDPNLLGQFSLDEHTPFAAVPLPTYTPTPRVLDADPKPKLYPRCRRCSTDLTDKNVKRLFCSKFCRVAYRTAASSRERLARLSVKQSQLLPEADREPSKRTKL